MTHPHHANAARKEDGTIDHEEIGRGAAYWMNEIRQGRVRIKAVNEVALDDKHDALIFVREKL